MIRMGPYYVKLVCFYLKHPCSVGIPDLQTGHCIIPLVFYGLLLNMEKNPPPIPCLYDSRQVILLAMQN